ADELRQAITASSLRLRTAREALRGTETRKKGEAVRKVVKAIHCHFEQVENPGQNEPTSRLVRGVIEPLEGDGLEVRDREGAKESPACPPSSRRCRTGSA